MKCITIYIATGLSSSSMSRIENTTNFLLISTFDGRLMNPAQVPFVYFVSLCTSDSPPSIPASTSSKSDIRGGSTAAKFDSGVMSLRAYVSVIARSTIASSSGVRPPSIIRKSPTRLIMFDRSTSALASSSRGVGRSNGLMWCSELREILKNRPPVASARYSYSRSGSSTITSVSNIIDRRISSFVVYDFPEPDLANVIEL